MFSNELTVARKYALGFGALGLLAASTPLLMAGLTNLALSALLAPVLGGVVTLVVARSIAGRLACRLRSSSRLAAAALGAAIGITSMESGTIVGSIFQFLVSDWTFGAPQAGFDYIVKPLYWISLVGGPVAFLLGVTGGLLVRRALRHLQHATASYTAGHRGSLHRG